MADIPFPKRILITGAGSGFGRGAALRLAELGHDVVAATLDGAQAESIRAENPAIEAIKLDITDQADIKSAADIAPDVLLNNAGRGQLGPLAEVSMELVRQVFEVNVFGTMGITRAIIPSMKEKGWGRIITVSSIAGLSSGALSGPYAMTKHALEAFSKSLRVEMQPYGIEVVKLNPGPYATGFNDAMVDGVDSQLGSDGGEVELELAAGTRTRMLGNQLDPNEVVDTMVELSTADEVPFETFKPDDILERYGIVR